MILSKDSATSVGHQRVHCTCSLLSPKQTLLWLTGRRRANLPGTAHKRSCKTAALFAEFRETGMSERLKYNSPADLRADYPQFFWQVVRPYIEDALRYLRVTQEGKQWIANLYANVFSIEHKDECL